MAHIDPIDLRFRWMPFTHYSVYWWALKSFLTKGKYTEPRKCELVTWKKSKTDIWIYWIKFYA